MEVRLEVRHHEGRALQSRDGRIYVGSQTLSVRGGPYKAGMGRRMLQLGHSGPQKKICSMTPYIDEGLGDM